MRAVRVQFLIFVFNLLGLLWGLTSVFWYEDFELSLTCIVIALICTLISGRSFIYDWNVAEEERIERAHRAYSQYLENRQYKEETMYYSDPQDFETFDDLLARLKAEVTIDIEIEIDSEGRMRTDEETT